MTPYFQNRKAAGKLLAKLLNAYENQHNVMVLALPRGGVPIGYEIAKALHLPLDLMLVRKLGVPGHEEYAMGAIAMGDVLVFHEDALRSLSIFPSTLEQVISRERRELMRRNNVYRGGRSAPNLKGKTVILVDDGMATGSNMRAAVTAARKQGAAKIIVAVPITSESANDTLNELADEIVCPFTLPHFVSLGHYYVDFRQMEDSEVNDLLKKIPGNANPTFKSKPHEPVSA